MMSPPHFARLAAAVALLAVCSAGPLGPLPNVTSSDMGINEGGCAVGEAWYAAGAAVPGAGPCERCRCAGARVACERARCQPRPGCKALHRPDHCCPTYQCECEQDGRVYGNGEKLVDPADPCRVCYCQGGEVVCRRIACFLRDDCSPRLVPGRCCPEYDNCPLRGVTSIPGVTSTAATIEEIPSSPAPAPPKENIKQEITIKEITPVSEIPIITEVKVKEILPSPGIEVPDYSSSKSPLIVREATTEKIVTQDTDFKVEMPTVVEMQPPESSESTPTKSSEKTTHDTPPSKISLSTQDSINREIYPSGIATVGSPSMMPDVFVATGTTKAPVVEEEDQSLFEHNPAFPPIPDDLSVLGNHEDEILTEQSADAEHGPAPPESSAAPAAPAAPTPSDHATEQVLTTTSTKAPETSPATASNAFEPSSAVFDIENAILTTTGSFSSNIDLVTSWLESSSSTERTELKGSPMLNLRSAIPTEILNTPSFVPEEINGELDEAAESITAAADTAAPSVSSSAENVVTIQETATEKSESPTTVSKPSESTTIESKDPGLPVKAKNSSISVSTTIMAEPEITTDHKTTEVDTSTMPASTAVSLEQMKPITEAKSSIVTEITAQTEFSSLPIETSDQNPQENSETIEKEKAIVSTVDPSPVDLTTAKISTPLESEVITVSRAAPSNTDNQSFENIETTEFVLTSFGSSETATDAVELIKISAEPDQSAAIIDTSEPKKNSVLNELINLVGDVATIGDHSESTAAPRPPAPAAAAAASSGISDSEELIPVNAGYKSKNNNWNVNSITEIPVKSKNSPPVTKLKVVEIEDEESESITDSSPPNDKVEPTTRRPIIDNVSDDGRGNSTEKKDIEIITKSYVPTISRRPTKVVMKKNNERPAAEQTTTESELATSSSEMSNSDTSLANSSSISTISDSSSPASSSSDNSFPVSSSPDVDSPASSSSDGDSPAGSLPAPTEPAGTEQ